MPHCDIAPYFDENNLHTHFAYVRSYSSLYISWFSCSKNCWAYRFAVDSFGLPLLRIVREDKDRVLGHVREGGAVWYSGFKTYWVEPQSWHKKDHPRLLWDKPDHPLDMDPEYLYWEESSDVPHKPRRFRLETMDLTSSVGLSVFFGTIG